MKYQLIFSCGNCGRIRKIPVEEVGSHPPQCLGSNEDCFPYQMDFIRAEEVVENLIQVIIETWSGSVNNVSAFSTDEGAVKFLESVGIDNYSEYTEPRDEADGSGSAWFWFQTNIDSKQVVEEHHRRSEEVGKEDKTIV